MLRFSLHRQNVGGGIRSKDVFIKAQARVTRPRLDSTFIFQHANMLISVDYFSVFRKFAE